MSPFKRPPPTADHVSPNGSAQREPVDDKTDASLNPTSAVILSRLEKILDLCGELRSLAKDVEQQVNSVATAPEQTVSKDNDSEQTLIDIYKELETQQALARSEEGPTAPPYQSINEMSSLQSDAHESHALMVG